MSHAVKLPPSPPTKSTPDSADASKSSKTNIPLFSKATSTDKKGTPHVSDTSKQMMGAINNPHVKFITDGSIDDMVSGITYVIFYPDDLIYHGKEFIYDVVTESLCEIVHISSKNPTSRKKKLRLNKQEILELLSKGYLITALDPHQK